MKHIGKNQSCNELNLGGQRFGCLAFNKLAASLHGCGSIAKLDVSECAKEAETIPIAPWATDFLLSTFGSTGNRNAVLAMERQTAMTMAVQRMLDGIDVRSEQRENNRDQVRA